MVVPYGVSWRNRESLRGCGPPGPALVGYWVLGTAMSEPLVRPADFHHGRLGSFSHSVAPAPHIDSVIALRRFGVRAAPAFPGESSLTAEVGVTATTMAY